ncbi:hypothetical protein [Halomicrococcus sp. NG-SE-24]
MGRKVPTHMAFLGDEEREERDDETAGRRAPMLRAVCKGRR